MSREVIGLRFPPFRTSSSLRAGLTEKTVRPSLEDGGMGWRTQMLTVIRPDRHVVKDTPTAKMFRRRLRFEDIFTFWNGETGEWILAYWVEKRRNLADEMEDLGMAFEKVTPDLISMIVTCWKPVNWKVKKQRLVSKERDRVRNEIERIQEEQRRWDWAKKKMAERGLKPIPYAFKSPVSGGQVM